MKAEHVQVELDRIEASKTNPRKSFPEEGLKELAASIREVGILQPLLVRACARPGRSATGPTYELVAGERRLRAVRLLLKGFKNGTEEQIQQAFESVPCVVRELTDDQVLEIQLIENLQREDVSALEEAEGFRRLIDAKKYTVESLAEKLGKSRSHVFGRLRLVNMDPLIKKALEKGDIDASKAQLLTQVKDKQELKNLVEWDAPGMSYRDLKEDIQRSYKNLNKAPFDTGDAKLVEGCPSCPECPKRSGNLEPGDKSPNVCTDPECYDKKEAADWKGRVVREKASGFTLLKDKNIFYDGKPGYSFDQNFFHASDKVAGDKEKRTWAKLNSDYLKQAVINPSYLSVFIVGKKRWECIKKQDAQKLAENMGIKMAKPPADRREVDYAAQRKRQEELRARRQKIEVEARTRILEVVRAAKVDKKFWEFLAALLREQYAPKIAGQGEEGLRVAIVAARLTANVDYAGNWSDRMKVAAEFAGVDLGALEKAAAAKTEGKETKPGVNAKAQSGKGAKKGKTGKKK